MNTYICIALLVAVSVATADLDCYTRCRTNRVSKTSGCEYYKIWVRCLDACLGRHEIWSMCKDRVAAFQAEMETEPEMFKNKRKMYECGYVKKTPEQYGC